MKSNKILKAISYVALSISIVTLILSIICIGIKNSEYLNEEKYLESERFAFDYIMSLRDIADKLIHDNSLYNSTKDGDISIYHIYNYDLNWNNLKIMNFLIIYKNKAITNVELNTINEIKQHINSGDSKDSEKGYKNVNILDGKIQTDTESIRKYGEKYLSNFLITYYTTDTNKTDTVLTDGRYIEYISTDINDFEIYSSYTEELYMNSSRQMALKFVDIMKPIYNNAYVIFPVSSILTILLVIYLVIVIGYDDNENIIKMNSFDYIPIEVISFFAILISCVPFIMLEVVENDYNAIISIAVTAYFVIYVCSTITMTTIIKRIKAKKVLKTSISGKIILLWLKVCKKLLNKVKDIWRTITYSASITSKVIISASIIIFIWIVILLLFGENNMFPLLIVALIGFIIYKIIKILKECSQIENKLKEIYDGNNKNQLNINEFTMPFKKAVTYLNDISNGFENAVQERMKSEKMKAELITNVSHDIKTPLTSIINYVNLLKQENIQNKQAEEYIEILDNKSQRLKKLTEDLVEASKISTGNISLKLEKINVVELIKQATGEFGDKFQKKGLEIIINSEENDICIMADSRYMYRIIDNLYSNISKYALENSRVYVDIKKLPLKYPVPEVQNIIIEIKNISKEKLNISAEELMQRFVRGDKSRTTEGSGLGISIAQNLTELQNGKFELKLDGDLFKVKMIFEKI